MALTAQTGWVTTSRRWVSAILGGLVVTGLVVAAVAWGCDGVEAAGWLVGMASLLVAVGTLQVTVPSSGSGSVAGGGC